MKKLVRKMDMPLFIMMLLYSLLGLVIILSASSVSAVLRYKVSSSYFYTSVYFFDGCLYSRDRSSVKNSNFKI